VRVGRGALLPQLLIDDALRSRRQLCTIQCCRHLQCDEWDLEHCCSQRRSSTSCSHIAAESWARYICRRPKCVACVDVSDCGGWFMGRGGNVLLPQLLIDDALRSYHQSCTGFQYCRHFHCVPCRLPLHHRHISMQPLRARHIQPSRRPIRMQLLRPRLVCQCIWSLAMLPLFRFDRLPATLHCHPQLRLQ